MNLIYFSLYNSIPLTMKPVRIYLLAAITVLLCNTANAQTYVTAYSGNGIAGFNNGIKDSATFSKPFGLCIDKNNNLYIADGGNNCIRKINTLTGMVTTLAGTGSAGFRDGIADSAMFNAPSDLCVDDSGNVYVSDFLNQRIRIIGIDDTVRTIAGTGLAGWVDGPANAAKFNYPRGICRDSIGNLFISDSWNHRIRKIDTLGIVSTYAGGGTSIGVFSPGAYLNGNDTNARFNTPHGIAIDEYGNIYVADQYNHRIRKIDTARVVTTIAGNGTTGPNLGAFMDGDSSTARLNTPTEIFISSTGDIYIGDTFNNRIRKLNMHTKDVTTFAGTDSAGFINGLDTLAKFNFPRGLVIDTSGFNMYVADYNNHAIRLIATTNNVAVPEIVLADKIIIYPNPTTGIFTVKDLQSTLHRIEVFDIVGNKIKEVKAGGSDSFCIDISACAKGMYLLKITDAEKKSLVTKVVKE